MTGPDPQRRRDNIKIAAPPERNTVFVAVKQWRWGGNFNKERERRKMDIERESERCFVRERGMEEREYNMVVKKGKKKERELKISELDDMCTVLKCV